MDINAPLIDQLATLAFRAAYDIPAPVNDADRAEYARLLAEARKQGGYYLDNLPETI